MRDSTFAIRQITFDCNDPSRLAEFWPSATGCEIVADYGDFVMVGSTPALGFPCVADPTPGKNRIHIDGGGTEREALVERLRICLLYTYDAADEEDSVDLGGRRII